MPQAFGQFIGPFCPAGCNDGNPCTNDGCNPVSGCVNTNNTAPCPDEGNACTDDVCDGLGVCGHPPRPPATACDDGAFCNGADSCDGAGTCLHVGDPCTGGTECADACNEAGDHCFDPAATASDALVTLLPGESTTVLVRHDGAGLAASALSDPRVLRTANELVAS